MTESKHTGEPDNESTVSDSKAGTGSLGAAQHVMIGGPFQLGLAFPTVYLPLLNLPKLDLGWTEHLRSELPQLHAGAESIAISTELAAAAKRWQDRMRPIAEIGAEFRKRYAAIMAPMAKFAEPLRRLQLVDAQCGRIESLGWLPHSNSPLELVAEEISDHTAIDLAAHAHYRDNWTEIGSALIAEIDACSIDPEAKATFAEAVAAHGAGLYRCAPRLLFPEIERVARNELHGGKRETLTSQHRLIDAIGGLNPAEISSTGVAGLRFYRKLTEHLYANVKEQAAVDLALTDPVPNRHAALHGIISYSSAKSSINAILAADYLLRAISTLKRLAVDDAADVPASNDRT